MRITFRPRQSGMSLAELLVGMTVGLMISLGAIALFVNNLGNTRRMTIEAQINQEMRYATDLISRDLRRAGYWKNAVKGTIAIDKTSVTEANAHIPVQRQDATTITYNHDQADDDVLHTSDQFGFALENGVIRMKTDANTWQDITNPAVITITGLSIADRVVDLPVGDICQKTCEPNSTSEQGACPTLAVRHYDLQMQGTAKKDSKVKRLLRASVRVRNDQFAGACPL